MHEDILTCYNLQKGGKYLCEYVLKCKGDFESMSHLLLHHKFTRALCELAFSGLAFLGLLPILSQLLFDLGALLS